MDAANNYLKDTVTLKQTIIRALALYSHREFTTGLSYGELHKTVAKWAYIIDHQTKSNSIAIIGNCGLFWVLADLSCTFCSKLSVGLHYEWPQNEMEYVLSKSDVGLLIILDVSANIEVIAEKSAFNVGVKSIRLSEILTLCAEAPLSESYIIPLSIDLDVEDEDSNSAELFSVMYTSGTSGKPKGVPVTRGQWRKNSINGPGGSALKPRLLIYNSMAHGSDRGRIWQTCMAGGKVMFSSENSLIEDMIAYRPTNIFAFGNWWNDFYLRCKTNNELQRRISTFSYDVEFVITGGTFTLPAAMSFLSTMFPNAQIVDSYGTTEAPGIASNGIVNEEGYELKLLDVPLQMYFVRDGYGEVLVRSKDGNSCCAYWQDSDASSASWDSDRWYSTGDIGFIDPTTKKLAIVDRKSNLIELYVEGRSVWMSSTKLETEIYGVSEHVSRIFIHGDRMHDAIVAVVLPASPAVTSEALLADFRRLAMAAKLKPWEIPSAVFVEPFGEGSWTSMNGLLSATGKLKRNALFAKYQEIISRLLAQRQSSSGCHPMQSEEAVSEINDTGQHHPFPTSNAETGCAITNTSGSSISSDSYTSTATTTTTTTSTTADNNVSNERPWQHSPSAGIVDYLDFQFSGLHPPEAAAEMNEVKEKMDNLVRLFRPQITQMDTMLDINRSNIKAEIAEFTTAEAVNSRNKVEKLLSITEKGPCLEAAVDDWIRCK
jgi:long-subunit acyl-CoA synthetase (AMP-forming)